MSTQIVPNNSNYSFNKITCTRVSSKNPVPNYSNYNNHRDNSAAGATFSHIHASKINEYLIINKCIERLKEFKELQIEETNGTIDEVQNVPRLLSLEFLILITHFNNLFPKQFRKCIDKLLKDDSNSSSSFSNNSTSLNLDHSNSSVFNNCGGQSETVEITNSNTEVIDVGVPGARPDKDEMVKVFCRVFLR